MNFGNVLSRMKRQGEKFYRKGWNGKEMYIALQVPDKNSKMGLPYIYISISTIGGVPVEPTKLVPWVASQTDILAEDWAMVK